MPRVKHTGRMSTGGRVRDEDRAAMIAGRRMTKRDIYDDLDSGSGSGSGSVFDGLDGSGLDGLNSAFDGDDSDGDAGLDDCDDGDDDFVLNGLDNVTMGGPTTPSSQELQVRSP